MFSTSLLFVRLCACLEAHKANNVDKEIQDESQGDKESNSSNFSGEVKRKK